MTELRSGPDDQAETEALQAEVRKLRRINAALMD